MLKSLTFTLIFVLFLMFSSPSGGAEEFKGSKIFFGLYSDFLFMGHAFFRLMGDDGFGRPSPLTTLSMASVGIGLGIEEYNFSIQGNTAPTLNIVFDRRRIGGSSVGIMAGYSWRRIGATDQTSLKLERVIFLGVPLSLFPNKFPWRFLIRPGIAYRLSDDRIFQETKFGFYIDLGMEYALDI